MGENAWNMQSEEVTKVCLEVLEWIKNDPNPISRHPNTISMALDAAIKKIGLNSELFDSIKHLPSHLKHLDFKMQELGFSDSVIYQVRELLAPHAGEIHTVIDRLLQKVPKTNLALNALITPASVMADFTKAMQQVAPYVKQNAMTEDAASEYAHIMTIRAIETNLNSGLSTDISDRLLSHWVEKHPEISEKMLTELNLGGVRDLQKIFYGIAQDI